MRGRVSGNSDMWWYGGSGDIGKYENMTSDCLTTTEDATECTDAKMRDPYKGYPVYPVYGSRFTRTCSPVQYFYPVKKRSRRRCVPSAYQFSYEGQKNMKAQHQMFLRDRGASNKSLAVGPRRRAAYTFSQSSPPLPPPPPDPVRKKQKVFLYSSTVPAQSNEDQQPAKVFWRKIKKIPGKGKIVSWCSQAVDSSTSADVISVRSNYSRLSVDVTNEMAAMNRDIETILTRYESAFDHSILNELEERGIGKKKKNNKPDVDVKSTPPQLTSGQKNLLAMEKPPLNRLAELPIEYLKPRPPPRVSVQETTNTSTMDGTDVWKGMLQDLVKRGIMDTLDDTSLAKLQSALNEAGMGEPKGMAPSSPTSPTAGNLLEKEEGLSGATCVLQPNEKTVLSEVDKHIQYASEALKKPTINVNYVRSAASRIPNLTFVERSEEFIPVNNLNDDTNWRRKLEEIQNERNKSGCEGCKTLIEQLNFFRRGGSGDKLCQDKSVNTDIGESSNESCVKNIPSGDQNSSDAHGVSERSIGHDRETRSTTSLQGNVKEIVSNVTVNSVLTDEGFMNVNSLASGTTSCICDDLTTNPSSGLGMAGVTVEDVEEEELPLQRTLESTSLGKGSRSSMLSHIRRPIKATSLSSQRDEFGQQNQSATGGTKVAKQGGGDSQSMDTSFKQNLASLVQNISAGNNSSPNTIDRNLADLRKTITQNTALLNNDICLEIIEKLAQLMISNEPVSGKDCKELDYITSKNKQMRVSHLRHINQEVAHLKQLDTN